MNFYKHHIGDYAQATAHLSFVEDAAYTRCLRKYYAEESALPADLKSVQRLIGARTREEKDAVQTVLDEFFELHNDGWHNKRADEEIGKANAQADANRKTAIEREERRRARREHESSTASLHEPSTNRDGDPSTNRSEVVNLARHQTPDSRHQTPDQEADTHAVPTQTDAGRVCLALKRTGLSGLNPGHPDLLALIAAGASEAEFVGAAMSAVDRGKGFAYALGTLKRQRIEAAQSAQGMHTGPLPQAPPANATAAERKAGTVQAFTKPKETNERPHQPDIIDI